MERIKINVSDKTYDELKILLYDLGRERGIIETNLGVVMEELQKKEEELFSGKDSN